MSGNNDDYDKAFNETMEPLVTALKENLSEDELAIMGKSAEKLKEQMPSPGLKVGSTAPDFSLPDAYGSEVTLSEELKNGPVILIFYRGAWCPVCSMHLNAIKRIAPMFKEKYNAQIVAVTPQQPDISKKQVDDLDIPFKVCSDLDDTAMKSFNLYFEVDAELNEVYSKLNIDLKADNGGRLSLPVPGTFIIDQSSVIRAMQADTDYKNRMKPDEISAGLESITQN